MDKYKFKAIDVNGSTDREEIEFTVCYPVHEGETLVEHAKQKWINTGDMSKAWIIERVYP